MKLLLDTHTFMWWHSEPEYIPKNTLILLQDPDNEVILRECLKSFRVG
jgi:PIN domain nuclease of toxin-antitoxin system